MAHVVPSLNLVRSHAEPLLARELVERGETATIVTVLCDSAEKYLSEHFWDES